MVYSYSLPSLNNGPIKSCIFVTRFYRTNPNRTSGKIKLTPPVDSYTIVLQVLTLSTTQTTRGWF